ncbi:MAG: glycosyltransferase [Alphaproteobacteria bacterium]|nr:glycosyltransferase [Alphaproteobacteria bacterium]
MRVMQVMAGGAQGGAEAFFERLTLALHRAGLAQRAVIRRNRARAHRLSREGVPVTQLPFGGPPDIYTRWAIGREIRAWRPDVVLTWMSRAAIKTPRSSAVLCGRLGGYYDLKYYRHCDHLIGNTEDIVDYIRKQGWPAERAHYLPNFVSSRRMDPLPRAEFETPAHAPLLVALGRLHTNKAFDILVDAMADVPDAYLWIAGAGGEEAALKKRVAALALESRIKFLGWRDDMEAVLAAGDIFVCPSRHEPLGNVVIEAFAQGLPVVAAASQGPKALIVDGTNGLLAPVDNAKALADAINRVIGDESLRNALAREGFATYQRQFTEAAVVANYRAFFEKVASGPSSRASRR